MRRYLTVLGLLAALGGCAGLEDPYQRAGTWRPEGDNDANLRAMVANPVDLQHGTGASEALGVTATEAVTRYRNDTVKALPDTNFSGIGPSLGGQGSGGGGGPAQ